jgi:site-specific DNA recombinase
LIAGIYLRRSSQGEEDKNSSIENQEEECRAWCTAYGHTITHIWRDPGGNSTTLARPVLYQAMEAARTGVYQLLVVWRYDRFSRVGAQQQAALLQLRRYGVEVVSVEQPVPDGPTGDLLRSVYGFSSETEHAGIVSRNYQGRRRRTLHGLLPGMPHPLYGYWWADAKKPGDKGRYVFNEESIDGNSAHSPARTVRRIHAWAQEAVSPLAIAARLKAESVPTPSQVLFARGQLSKKRQPSPDWSAGTIIRILTNPSYKGEYTAWRDVVDKVLVRDKLTGEMVPVSVQKPRDADDEALVRLEIPALIPPDKWAETQHALHTSLRTSGLHRRATLGRPDNLLVGIATCGHCGKPIVRKWQHSVRYYRYGCSSTTGRGGAYTPCTTPAYSYKAGDVDALVVCWLLHHIEEPDLLRARLAQQQEQERIARAITLDNREALATLVDEERQQEEMALHLAAESRDKEHAGFFLKQAQLHKANRLRYEAEVQQGLRSAAEEAAEAERLEAAIERLLALRPQLETLSYDDTDAESVSVWRAILRALGVQVRFKREGDESGGIGVRWQLDSVPEVLQARIASASAESGQARYDKDPCARIPAW